jgi:ABC-type Fe3+ transport system permease subunit
MDLKEDHKFQVLLADLQERYSSSHMIRERSVKFTLWISGMAIGLGWLLISQKTLTLAQQVALTLLILALFAGTLYFLKGLRRGFQKNREAMINCESALGML